MFKEKLKGFIVGAIVSAVVVGSLGVVFAEEVSKTIDVAYQNIKIFVDGAEYVAKDANGEIVEPFIYNGTTYLPVRGIANAFGKDVVWDGINASIYLGKKDQNQPDNYLDRMQYSYVGKGNDDYNFWIINGKITDHLKNDYNNGLLFNIKSVYVGHWGIPPITDDSDQANIQVDYPLNSAYSKVKIVSVK